MSPHGLLLEIAVGWGAVLVGILAVRLVRARDEIMRVIYADAVAVTVAGTLGILSFREREVYYLDAALALVLLAQIGTVAAADRIRRRELG